MFCLDVSSWQSLRDKVKAIMSLCFPREWTRTWIMKC